jgi:outer membrane protein OmpA-like peptidoglycan-associated protein
MLGFEMAYNPSGNYYATAAQQVIMMENNTTLHEPKKPLNLYASSVVSEGSEESTSASSINKIKRENLIIFYPQDKTIPFHKAKVKSELKDLRGEYVVITGNASKEGGSKHNMKLSKKRAQRVAAVARKFGINVISVKARGSKDCKTNSLKLAPQCRKVDVQVVDGN